MATISILGSVERTRPMATTAARGGHTVRLWSPVNQFAVKSLSSEAIGAVLVAQTASQALADAEYVFTQFSDDEESKAFWSNTNMLGDELSGRRVIAIECSDLSPEWAKEWHEMLDSHGIHTLDAPVVGSLPQAMRGELCFLVGGAPAVLSQVREVLLTMGADVQHAGGAGAGVLAKRMVRGICGAQVMALARVLDYASHHSDDLERLSEVISSSTAASSVVRAALPRWAEHTQQKTTSVPEDADDTDWQTNYNEFDKCLRDSFISVPRQDEVSEAYDLPWRTQH